MHCIYFDLDGTLLNTRNGIAESIGVAMLELGTPPLSEAQLQSCFGPPIRDSFARLLHTEDKALIEQATRLFREHYLEQGIHNYQVYPGIEAMLQQLANRDITLRVLTVKPLPQAEWLLQHAQLSPLFASIHGSEYNGLRSDKSDHLQSLLQESPYSTEQLWMIGDRANDIDAAKNCGIHSVAVSWGYGEQEELSQADHLIHHPNEMISLLPDQVTK